MLQWRVEAVAPGREHEMDPELVRRMVPCSLGLCAKRVLLPLECEWCGRCADCWDPNVCGQTRILMR